MFLSLTTRTISRPPIHKARLTSRLSHGSETKYRDVLRSAVNMWP
jgi:hypothetical protein